MTDKTKIKAKVDTIAKKEPIDSTDLPEDAPVLNVPQGKEYDIISVTPAANDHILVELDYEAGSWYFYAPHIEVSEPSWYLITKPQLQRILPNTPATLIDKYFVDLNKAMAKYQINTANRIAAFIAQLAHESGGFRYAEELASGVAYNNRRDLGNHLGKDYGIRFKGRGLIQLTGYYNYKKYGDLMGVDLIENPTLASTPKYATEIACAYWAENKLNRFADSGKWTDFKTITQRINGGFNGLDDRRTYWLRARSVLGL